MRENACNLLLSDLRFGGANQPYTDMCVVRLSQHDWLRPQGYFMPTINPLGDFLRTWQSNINELGSRAAADYGMC